MIDFKKDDDFWSIDVFMERGIVLFADKKRCVVQHDENSERIRRATANTKEECINDIISELENLRDFPSVY